MPPFSLLLQLLLLAVTPLSNLYKLTMDNNLNGIISTPVDMLNVYSETKKIMFSTDISILSHLERITPMVEKSCREETRNLMIFHKKLNFFQILKRLHYISDYNKDLSITNNITNIEFLK